jgi:hypothetical protein
MMIDDLEPAEDVIVLEGEPISAEGIEEGVQFLIVEDPTKPDDETAWAVLLEEEPFKDWVVKFHGITLDRAETLTFDYELLSSPDSETVPDHDVFLALLTGIVNRIITEAKKNKTLVAHDV